MHNNLFYVIVAILVLQYILDTFLNYLNAKNFGNPLPDELKNVFDQDEYQKSQDYKKTNYRFGILTSTFSLLLTLAFLNFGGFEWVDQIARQVTDNDILIALIFFGVIMIGSSILTTPFSYYRTFVIEEKFGFNNSTFKLFILDKIKGLADDVAHRWWNTGRGHVVLSMGWKQFLDLCLGDRSGFFNFHESLLQQIDRAFVQ